MQCKTEYQKSRLRHFIWSTVSKDCANCGHLISSCSNGHESWPLLSCHDSWLCSYWLLLKLTGCARGRTICPAPPAAAQLQSIAYTPYTCGAQRTLRHEYSWSTGSGSLWLWLWCRPYKSCSDLNSQPKRPGDLVTLKVVSESRVTWATSVPILVFLGLSVLDLGPMYATDRRQTKA